MALLQPAVRPSSGTVAVPPLASSARQACVTSGLTAWLSVSCRSSTSSSTANRCGQAGAGADPFVQLEGRRAEHAFGVGIQAGQLARGQAEQDARRAA